MNGKPRSLTPVPGYRHPSASAWQAGCGCEACKAYRRRKNKLRQMYGSSRVDAAPVILKVERLVAEGYSRQAIAAAAGLSNRTLHGNTLTSRKTLWKTTATPLMKLTREDIIRKSPPTSLVPVIGASRRLQAIMRMGWRMRDIAATAAEYHMVNAVRTADPGTRITAGNFLRIVEMFDRFAMEPGQCRGNATKAKGYGYAPPLAWNDIDDPRAEPDTGDPDDLRAWRGRRMRALYDQGLSDEAIGDRLGYSRDTVRHWRLQTGLSPSSNRGATRTPLGEEGDNRYKLWLNGNPDQDIAQLIGRHVDVIRRWRKKHGLLSVGRKAS